MRFKQKLTLAPYLKDNYVLIFCGFGVLAWVGFSDGLWFLFKYIIYLSCVITSGMFVACISQMNEKKFNKKLIVILAVTFVSNLLAAYFAFPKLLLVVALWLPAIIGYIYSKVR